MQRSPALQPLSREHHAALKLALLCERAAISADESAIQHACRHVLQSYTNELDAHFLHEERTLLPLLSDTPDQPLAERTLEEHRSLRELLNGLRQNSAAALRNFGIILKMHVRFEEQELFPALERRLAHRNMQQ